MRYSSYSTGDAAEIELMFTETFANSEGRAEGEMIGRLVRDFINSTDEADIYGFVAREKAEILGGIFFSRITFEREINAFILAPVAVRTGHQGRGVGQALIRFGLDALAADGVELVLTYGDPAFYSKVGFRAVFEAVVPPPLPLSHPEGWLAQSLSGGTIEPIAGSLRCVEALNRPEYW